MFSLTTHQQNLLQKMENNDMNTTESRREFEKWAFSESYTTIRHEDEYDDYYISTQTECGWRAWQAARGQLEKQLRIALHGHPDSQLWGDRGLLAATMRCVYGYEKLERKRDEARRNRDNLIKLIEPFKYWRDISECDCSNPLPQGGCLRCDLERILSEILTSEKI
jgi:hypothetical protein